MILSYNTYQGLKKTQIVPLHTLIGFHILGGLSHDNVWKNHTQNHILPQMKIGEYTTKIKLGIDESVLWKILNLLRITKCWMCTNMQKMISMTKGKYWELKMPPPQLSSSKLPFKHMMEKWFQKIWLVLSNLFNWSLGQQVKWHNILTHRATTSKENPKYCHPDFYCKPLEHEIWTVCMKFVHKIWPKRKLR